MEQRSYRWIDWKALALVRDGQHQHVEDTAQGVYTIWFYDGPETHLTNVWTGAVPDGVTDAGYTQEQNDSDKADFETNFKPTSNGTIVPRAPDGRLDVRTTIASKAKNYRLRPFSVVPGDATSLVNLYVDMKPLTDITVTCYDVNSKATTDATVSVKTVIDLEPPYDYEIIGGSVDIPPS